MVKRKKKRIIKWDDHMVTAVILASGLCILLMLASFMSITGKAIEMGYPSSEKILEILNQNTQLVENEGWMDCDYACATIEKYALISSFDGEHVENTDVKNGQYKCLCVSN